MTHHSLLITGPEENRCMFHLRVCNLLNLIDGRFDTVRYTCMPEDLKTAMKAAAENDVTIQEIVMVGKNETYEVRHLGTHLMKWEPKETKGTP